MPSKPQSAAATTTKDVDDAVQAISEKLGSLQSQVLDLQSIQDSRHDTLQAMMHTLLEQFTTFTTNQLPPPPPSLPTLVPITIPTPPPHSNGGTSPVPTSFPPNYPPPHIP